MARYAYKTRDHQGQLATGVLQAASPTEAAGILRGEGKFVVAVTPAHAGSASPDAETPAPSSKIRVPRKEVINFSHQLAIMIDTGVPISDALQCILDQTDHERFKTVLEKVADHVRSGGELSVVMQRFPKVFPPIMTSLVQASEVSGTMGSMLDRISSYLTKEYQMVRKIRGALVYPVIMLVMVLIVTTFLLTFILPKFTKIYQAKHAALPGPTRFLITLSNLLIHDWYLWLIAAAMLGVGGWLFRRTQLGLRTIDYIKLNTPVVGSLLSRVFLTRTCRTMGTMLTAGVPVLDMVATVRKITRNYYYDQLWDSVDERLRRGTQLSDALFESPLIPRQVAQMILAGEKAGRLGTVMEKIASFTEQELDEQIKTTTQLVEPAMIVVMGSVVGFVAIALLLPIFSISHVITGK